MAAAAFDHKHLLFANRDGPRGGVRRRLLPKRCADQPTYFAPAISCHQSSPNGVTHFISMTTAWNLNVSGIAANGEVRLVEYK